MYEKKNHYFTQYNFTYGTCILVCIESTQVIPNRDIILIHEKEVFINEELPHPQTKHIFEVIKVKPFVLQILV